MSEESILLRANAKVARFKAGVVKRACERRLHKEFVKEHKTLLRVFDVLMIMSVLMNFGAIMMTNAMVLKDTDPEKRFFVEANPSVAESQGFKTTPEAQQKFFSLVRFIYLWSFFLVAYLFLRLTVTEVTFLALAFLVAIYFLGLGLDFFNNLGYLIGTMIWW